MLAQARASLEGNLNKMQAEFDFQDRAASLRKDRKLNKLEEKLIYAWVGRTEEEVVTAMGNPRLNEAGDQRFLHYMRYFDNTAQVVEMKSGATWEEGNYSECNVEFVRLEKDMVAVRLTPDLNMMAVASPDYLARRGTPKTPAELHGRACINWRLQGTAGTTAGSSRNAGNGSTSRWTAPSSPITPTSALLLH